MCRRPMIISLLFCSILSLIIAAVFILNKAQCLLITKQEQGNLFSLKMSSCHYIMMMSSNGNIFCVDVFFDLRLNKRLSKQPWAGDWRRHRGHYDVNVMMQFRYTNISDINHLMFTVEVSLHLRPYVICFATRKCSQLNILGSVYMSVNRCQLNPCLVFCRSLSSIMN